MATHDSTSDLPLPTYNNGQILEKFMKILARAACNFQKEITTNIILKNEIPHFPTSGSGNGRSSFRVTLDQVPDSCCIKSRLGCGKKVFEEDDNPGVIR